MMKRILILEDDVHLSKSLQMDFIEHGYQVTIMNSFKENKIEFFSSLTHALIDLRLSEGGWGLNAVEKIKALNPQIKIIVLTGYGSVKTAVEALKKGVQDYLTKPASFEEIEDAFNGKIKLSQKEFTRPTLSQVEHNYIDFVLTKNKGNISQTAKELGLHRQSLQRKLKKYT